MRELVLRSGQGERHFRWRGKDVSRVENFSDIVFALTLSLVVASSVPATFSELLGLWREAFAAAACFALLYMIWRAHYLFFRRYDLEDGRTVFLNIVLLFLVMVFAYPLKFLALFLADLQVWLITLPPGKPDFADRLSYEDAPRLAALYASGYAGVFIVFSLLYAHAASLGDDLDLDARERIMTRLAVAQSRVHVAVALLVVVLAVSLPTDYAIWSGGLFFVLGPLLSWMNRRALRRIQTLEDAQSP